MRHHVVLVCCLLPLTSPVSQTSRSQHRSARLLSSSLAWGEGSRRQDIIPENQSFPCSDKNRASVKTPAVPSSVHKLRPRDIRVVATLGDSLVAGFGALAESLPQLLKIDTGVSWAIGGDGNWRNTLTLPNLLREFSPRVVGAARTGGSYRQPQHLGMGEPQSHDDHLLGQAKRLVAAIKQHPDIDGKKDWKLVTILSGHNDLCSGDPCFPPPKFAAQQHYHNLKAALDYLRDNLPRTFVSLLPVLDVSVGWQIEKSLVCGVLSMIECRCLYTGRTDDVTTMKQLVKAYHQAEKQLVESGGYDREDFSVELQRFTAELIPPRNRNFLGFYLTDLSLFSVDCFHLSQKGHAAFATMQWNNLLQAEGNKSSQFLAPMQNLICPSERSPFLFTRKNSRHFHRTGKQLI